MTKDNRGHRDSGDHSAAGKMFESEHGAALVLVIVLSTIALLIMTTVLYMVTVGTQLSGSEKRYRTAHDAALGGIEIITNAIQQQSTISVPGVNIVWNGTFASKLAGGDLPATNSTIDPNDSSTYDLYADLGNPPYRVFAKIVQIKKGNTTAGYRSVTLKTGVVPAWGRTGTGTTSTFYSFSVLSEKASNPNERVKMDLVQIF